MTNQKPEIVWPSCIQFNGDPKELKFLLRWYEREANSFWALSDIIDAYACISQQVKDSDIPIYKVQIVEDLIREFYIPVTNSRGVATEDEAHAMFVIDDIYKSNHQHMGKITGTGRKHRDLKLVPKSVD